MSLCRIKLPLHTLAKMLRLLNYHVLTEDDSVTIGMKYAALHCEPHNHRPDFNRWHGRVEEYLFWRGVKHTIKPLMNSNLKVILWATHLNHCFIYLQHQVSSIFILSDHIAHKILRDHSLILDPINCGWVHNNGILLARKR